MFMTKSQLAAAFGAVERLGKRALPTLGAILKVSRLNTLLKPFAEEDANQRTMLLAKAEHIAGPAGQDILVEPDLVNGEYATMMSGGSDFKDPGIRIVAADLPKLPEWSDDAEKQKKYLAAREELANDIAGLGVLFDYEEKPV